MVVATYTEEFVTPIPPAKLFKALILDSHNFVPKVLPQYVKSVEFVHGNGGVGSIKQVNFPEGAPCKFMKHKIDALDLNNYVCKYTLIESDLMIEKLEKIVYELKMEASGGGCICKLTSHYHTKGESVLSEEKVKEGQAKHTEMYKVVAEYLVANPNACA